MPTKTCPFCTNAISSANYARHIRRCKGPRRKPICSYCNKTFLINNLKRHEQYCKTLCQAIRTNDGILDVGRNDVSGGMYQHQTILLEMLRQKDTELLKTRQELADARQELALREMTIVKLQAEKRLAPVHNHNNNNYYQMTYAIHMTPWGLDPSSPSYEGSLCADVRNVRPLMERLNPLPSLEEFVDLDENDKQRHSRPRQKVLFDAVRDGLNLDKPRYIVLDCARQKGLFTSPDGSVKIDPRMSLLMEHQRRIAVATTPHRGWYFKKGTLSRFHDMVATDGRNGALRIAKMQDDGDNNGCNEQIAV